MNVRCFTNGPFKQNCYLLDDLAGACLLIDPGSDAEEIAALISDKKLLAILNTHGHFDHIGAVADLQDRYDVLFYCHRDDRKLIKRANLYQLVFRAEQGIRIPSIDKGLEDGQSLSFGSFSVDVLHTPGHTPGSVSLLINEQLFTGDTLIAGKIGRSDLPGGDPSLLKDSLVKLAGLDPETVFYPGHGPASTIGQELRQNPELMEVLRGDHNPPS